MCGPIKPWSVCLLFRLHQSCSFCFFNSSSHYKDSRLKAIFSFPCEHYHTLPHTITSLHCYDNTNYFVMFRIQVLLSCYCFFPPGVFYVLANSIQSSLNPKPLSVPTEKVQFDWCQANTTFHCCLLYTFNTWRFPLCPLLSSAACGLTLERASVCNKRHCLTWIGMLVWTTGFCYRGSLCLCLVNHSGPLGSFLQCWVLSR